VFLPMLMATDKNLCKILQTLFDNIVQRDSNMYLYDFYMNAFTCFGPLRPSSEGKTTCRGNYYYIDLVHQVESKLVKN
jgi:hypothetical protein